jgi:hypothetical protein
MFNSAKFLSAGSLATLAAIAGFSLISAPAKAHGPVVRVAVVSPVRVVAVRPVYPVRPAITRYEAARLRYQHHELQQAKRIAAADGVITRREDAWIDHEAHQLRRMYFVAKTN